MSKGLPDTFNPTIFFQIKVLFDPTSPRRGILGIEPEKLLLETSNNCKVSNAASSDGMFPINMLSFNLISVTAD